MSKKTETKRKLTLNRETLRALEGNTLDGVMGGINAEGNALITQACTRIYTDCICDTRADCG